VPTAWWPDRSRRPGRYGPAMTTTLSPSTVPQERAIPILTVLDLDGGSVGHVLDGSGGV